MPNINDIFSGSFLKADDLKGQSPTVTIESVEVKDFDDGKKLILHFVGKDRALIMNKTNANICAEVLGSSDTEDWEGKRITLTVRKVEFQGKIVPAIRVSLDPPTTGKAKPAPVPAKVEPAYEEGGDEVEIPF